MQKEALASTPGIDGIYRSYLVCVHFLLRKRKRTKRNRPRPGARRAALRFSQPAGPVELAALRQPQGLFRRLLRCSARDDGTQNAGRNRALLHLEVATAYSKYTSFLKIYAPAISKGGTARGWGLRTVIDSAKKKGRQPGHKYSQRLRRRQGRRLDRKSHTRRVWSGLTPHEVQTGCFCWPLASQANSRRHKRAKRFGRCTAVCDAGFTVPPSGRALHLPCALRFHR